MKNAKKRVFTCKDRCQYSRKRAKFAHSLRVQMPQVEAKLASTVRAAIPQMIAEMPLEEDCENEVAELKMGKLLNLFSKFCKFLAGSFSAVSKRNFASKYAFDSIFQNLPDYIADICKFGEILQIWRHLQNCC